MPEVVLANSQYWKGQIYLQGKQHIPDELAAHLGLTPVASNAIAPSQQTQQPQQIQVSPVSTAATDRKIAQLEEQITLLANFYKQMQSFFGEIESRLNYVPEVQYYSGGAFTGEIGAVTNSNPKQHWHFANAKTNKPSSTFDARAKDAIVLRGGTTYWIEISTTIYSFAAANATLSSTFVTEHTPAPEVFVLIGPVSRFKDDHQYPNNGLLIVKIPGKKEDFITYNARVFRATGTRIQGDAFVIVREMPDNRNPLDTENLQMLMGTATFKQELTVKVQSTFPSGFNFHLRSSDIPEFETYQVGGFFQEAGNPNIWGISEKEVTCKAVTPVQDLHDTNKYPFLFPKVENNQGYRFEVFSDRALNINIPFESGNKKYELNFGVYGNGLGGWFLNISDLSADTTINLTPANSTLIDFNRPGDSHIVEIGVCQGKWLIVIDQYVLNTSAIKLAAPLVHPDKFPLIYKVAPKQVGATTRPERIGYI